MKLSNVFAKLTGMKAGTVGVLAAATLAGAILTTAAPQAEAQHFGVGVQIGGPAYYAPPPPVRYYGYDDHRRYDDWRERQEFERRQEWLRFHEYRDHDFYHHDFDHHDHWDGRR